MDEEHYLLTYPTSLAMTTAGYKIPMMDNNTASILAVICVGTKSPTPREVKDAKLKYIYVTKSLSFPIGLHHRLWNTLW